MSDDDDVERTIIDALEAGSAEGDQREQDTAKASKEMLGIVAEIVSIARETGAHGASVMSLYDYIRGSKRDVLQLGWLNPAKLDDRINRIEQSAAPLVDEQVLTYLCAYGYAIAPNGPQALARVLLQNDALIYDGKIWFEFLPVSPRHQEGETHFDLALGDVQKRSRTHSGLEFTPPTTQPSWIAAIEAKLHSDLSALVTYDVFRNQLLRVIENAVTLRDATDNFPARVHVVLLTPKVFKDHPQTRFYGCKFQEYCPNGTVNPAAILADLDRLALPVAHKCDMAERLSSLSLHWATYEDVIGKMPDGDFKTCLLRLVNRHGSLVRV
jgi:hypothetical protein